MISDNLVTAHAHNVIILYGATININPVSAPGDKYPFLCVHTDLLRSKKTSSYVIVRFEGRFCKTSVFVFLLRSSVNS